MIYIFIFLITFVILIFLISISNIITVGVRNNSQTIPNNLSSRDEISLLLQKEKFASGIEIGVQSGIYSDILLSKWNCCSTYVMVDPWLKQKNYDDAANVNNEEQNRRFSDSMNVVTKYSSRVNFIILKTTSEKAVAYLKGNLFDFIYLDGRHDYLSVKSDIDWYYPLLKSGGIFAGHDYQDENGEEWMMDKNGNKNNNHKAVKSAVDEFAKSNKLEIVITNEKIWKSWMIRKP